MLKCIRYTIENPNCIHSISGINPENLDNSHVTKSCDTPPLQRFRRNLVLAQRKAWGEGQPNELMSYAASSQDVTSVASALGQ